MVDTSEPCEHASNIGPGSPLIDLAITCGAKRITLLGGTFSARLAIQSRRPAMEENRADPTEKGDKHPAVRLYLATW
jgi:hypothetical protein